jgi:hypothetical protein
MKIAILGAPGSGKTEVAGALADKFGNSYTAIVDEYVDKLSVETNVAFGHVGGFLGNLQVAFERLRCEQMADTYNADHIITCGTLVETTLYTRLYAEARVEVAPKDEIHRELARATNAAMMYGQLVWDTWRYDYVFVNPLPEEKVDDSWDSILNNDLISGLEAFFIQHQVLKPTTAEEKADWIAEFIHRQEKIKRDASPDER